MLIINPEVYEYTESERYIFADNTYCIVDSTTNGQIVIQHIKHLFWIFWVTTDKPFPTWDACIKVKVH